MSKFRDAIVKAADMQVSFVMETNHGGIPVSICACGVLLMHGHCQSHLDACQAVAEWEANRNSEVAS